MFNLIYMFWLHWIFIAARRLSLVVAGRDNSSSWCMGFSLRRLLLLPAAGSRALGLQELSLLGSREQPQRLWCMGLVALRHVVSFQTRDQRMVNLFKISV